MKCKSCGSERDTWYWPNTAEHICSRCWGMWMRAKYGAAVTVGLYLGYWR